MNYPKLYLEAIKNGEEVVSEKVRVVYEREVGWMDNPPDDFPYYFDDEEGERHIEFVEKFCKHSKGKFAGKNLKLELFDIKKRAFDDSERLSMSEPVNVESPQRRQRKSGMHS